MKDYDPIAIQLALEHASVAQLIDLRVCIIADLAEKLTGFPEGLDPIVGSLGEQLFMMAAVTHPECVKELQILTEIREKALEQEEQR